MEVIAAVFVDMEGRIKTIRRNTSTAHNASPKFAAQNDPITGRRTDRVLNPTTTVTAIIAA